jgi:hypothetical protein
MRARNDVNNEIATNGEQRLQREVLDMLRQRSVNAVMFDGGANIGDWTLSLITVRCYELALSCDDDEAHMLGEAGLGTSSIHVGIDNQQYDRVRVVRMKADTYCDENAIHEVHLLKCDTEGHDFEVITGAHNLLKNGRVWFFQFEYNHRWIYSRHYLKAVFDLSESIPYKLAKVTPKGLELYDTWDPELERFFEGNYLLIRDDLENLVTTWRVSRDSHNTFVG